MKKVQQTIPSAPETAPVVANYITNYRLVIQELIRDYPLDQAMSLARGGDMYYYATLGNYLLRDAGLKAEHKLIDIGCGPGALSEVTEASQYLGTDIVPEVLDYARGRCQKTGHTFAVVNDSIIPAEDTSADFICAYSVFTHIVHEDSYRYLREMHRVLRPGGKVVFSFLEFIDSSRWQTFEWQVFEWQVFEMMVKRRDDKITREHTQFMDRDMIKVWAEHLGFVIERFIDASEPSITVEKPHTLDNGVVLEGKVAFGQSVCVMRKI